jgi:hypothetical protein
MYHFGFLLGGVKWELEITEWFPACKAVGQTITAIAGVVNSSETVLLKVPDWPGLSQLA